MAIAAIFLAVLCRILACAAATTTTTAPSFPTCAASGSPPVMLGEPLSFCGLTGLSCCDAVDDDALRDQLHTMNVPDATCAAILKSFLCARCIPSLSHVFNTVDPSMSMELLVPLLCASTSSSCPAQHESMPASDTMCLERISGGGSFQAMAAHPDGSGRVFLSSREGKIWLATMPRQGSGGALSARLFLDLTDRVHHDAVLGLVGMAFHPDFATNGRFFVSYNCDTSSSPTCGAGRCWGDAARNGPRPCRYQLVVAEFSAQGGGAGADYSKATRAARSEVRRIFTMSLPQPHKLYSYQSHSGQILFRPGYRDGLYLITGHGDFSNDGRRSLFGKILRFDVDNGGSSQQTGISGSTPKMMYKPEIFAVGLDNPSACSFDSDMPSHLFCGEVNDELNEGVYQVREGANYGNATPVINHGRPKEGRMPSIVGGLVYHGSADPSLNARYLYVYSSGVWTVPVGIRSSGRYANTHVLNVRCSQKSPVPCQGSGIGIGNGIGGRVLSLGEDNSKDAFFLTTAGMFRVVAPGACSVVPAAGNKSPGPQWPPGTGWVLSFGAFCVLFVFYMVWSTLSGGGNTKTTIKIGNTNTTNNFTFQMQQGEGPVRRCNNCAGSDTHAV